MLQIAECKVLRVKAKEKIMSKTVLKTKHRQKNKGMFKNSYRQWTMRPIFIFQYLESYRMPLTKFLYFICLVEQLVCVGCLQSQIKKVSRRLTRVVSSAVVTPLLGTVCIDQI